ncbi:MAG: ATP-binding protein [Phenylobacterium sp.]|uniref:ATP-binding protein n=1 Tax=Phenylobacterium sp. TaxID=1871053 RepID=UPI003918B295
MSWIDKLKPRFGAQRGLKPSGAGLNITPPAAEPPPRETAGSTKRRPAQPAFPRFQFTAGDQLDPRQADRFATVRMRLRSAYTPSQPITDRRMFAGRTEVLTTLIRAIEDQRLHTVLYGERGIGKTSLLHVLTQAAREARYLVVYVSCGAGSNFDEMFRTVAGAIPLLYHADYGPTHADSERGATMADLLPSEPVSVRVASNMLAKITGTRVLVVLDEFDRCESAAFRRSIAELLKNLSDRSVRVQLVIAGVAANLAELVEHIPSIQRNVFALQVPIMMAAEVRHLVNNGAESCGLAFDDAAARFVVSVANGLPYLASLLSHHAGLIALDDGRVTVTVEDVSAAIAEALGELRGRISKKSQVQIANSVNDQSQRFLGILAGAAQAAGGQFNLDDISALCQGEDVARCKALVEHLADSGLLIEADEDEFGPCYRFMEESVPSYLTLLSAQSRFFEAKTAAKPAPTPRAAAEG